MKKLLVAVLACAMVAPAFAAFDNVKVTGDIQTIGFALEGQGTNNITNPTGAPAADTLRVTQNRVLLGISADLVEDVNAKITLAHERIWGTPAEDIGTLEWSTLIQEAYVNISNVFDALEVKVGRQFYGDEKSAVMYFGPAYGYINYNTTGAVVESTVNAVDGVTARYNGDNLTLTAAYLTSFQAAPYTAADVEHIAGLDGILKVNDNLGVQAYVYDTRTRGANTFGFVGVKPTFETDVVKAGVELAQNYGQAHGWLIKADVALPLEMDDMALTPRATFLKMGKGFSAYGNYRPGLIFGTLAANAIDVVGGATTGYDVTNLGLDTLEVVNAGLCMKFAALEKWGFGFDFYRARMDGQFVGNSWEAKVIYNHNEYVAFNLTGAILTGVGQKLGESPAAVQLGMNIKF